MSASPGSTGTPTPATSSAPGSEQTLADGGSSSESAPSPFGGGITVEPGAGGPIIGTLPLSPYGVERGSDTTRPKAAASNQLTGLVRIVSTVDFGAGRAIGTGMVVTADGEVVTNHHVVAGATSIRVTVVSTGQSYTATVVGADATDDVAVLQLDGTSGLTTAPLARRAAHVGDTVTAVGDADGLHRLSAASGRVTAVGQAITTQSDATTAGERLNGLIEIDADVVSGDSGGATLNTKGRVVGMTTAASSGASDITGYAIPIAKVVRIAAAIETGTETARIDIGYPAFLGVELSGISTEVAGTVVDSAAADAGIVGGDTVTSVDGTLVDGGRQLRAAVAAHEPGDRVAIAWTDARGASHTATVTLGNGPVA